VSHCDQSLSQHSLLCPWRHWLTLLCYADGVPLRLARNCAHSFRCIKGFICQFGIGATPELNAQWKEKGSIIDDPHVLTNGGFLARGMLSFAGGGADSRTTQLFVSLRDSKYLGKAAWETPVGQIVEGMDVVDAW
jgi:cyclophilin family peptidyl-prolyl cis-trans isomerase